MDLSTERFAADGSGAPIIAWLPAHDHRSCCQLERVRAYVFNAITIPTGSVGGIGCAGAHGAPAAYNASFRTALLPGLPGLHGLRRAADSLGRLFDMRPVRAHRRRLRTLKMNPPVLAAGKKPAC